MCMKYKREMGCKFVSRDTFVERLKAHRDNTSHTPFEAFRCETFHGKDLLKTSSNSRVTNNK